MAELVDPDVFFSSLKYTPREPAADRLERARDAASAQNSSAHSRASGNPGSKAGSPLPRGRTDIGRRSTSLPSSPILLLFRRGPWRAVSAPLPRNGASGLVAS